MKPSQHSFLGRGMWIGAALVLLSAPIGQSRPLRADVRPQAGTQNATASSSSALSILQKGYGSLSQKDYAAAEADFRQAVSALPKLASAHHGLGLALWDEGKRTQALQEFTAAAGLDPGDFALHYDLAEAEWAMAQDSEEAGGADSKATAADYRGIAIIEMRKALALNSKDADVHLNLARLYLQAKQPDDSISEAREAERLAPSNPAAAVALGDAYASKGNAVQATAAYQKAIQLNSHGGEGYLALGELLASQNKLPQAEAAFRQAIQAAPNLEAAYAALGQVLQQAQQPAEAVAALNRALQLDPRDWMSEFTLGEVYEREGNVAEAMKLYQNVLQLNPGFLPVRERYALDLVRRGDLAGATTQADSISSHNPAAPEGHRVMALVLWKQRNYDASLAECAMALAADSHSARTLAIQALDLWEQGQRSQARYAYVAASKLEANLTSALVFCRLVECGAGDITMVEDFIRKNRWALEPPGEQDY
jgi:tetratricopeptide (TPR) repeat protein